MITLYVACVNTECRTHSNGGVRTDKWRVADSDSLTNGG